MESKIVSIEFIDDVIVGSEVWGIDGSSTHATDLFSKFCKEKEIRKENIVSINYRRDNGKTAILLVYEGRMKID
jgi:hypothetical protein